MSQSRTQPSAKPGHDDKAGKPAAPMSRNQEALHKGTDPAYPADEARASEPGREEPE